MTAFGEEEVNTLHRNVGGYQTLHHTVEQILRRERVHKCATAVQSTARPAVILLGAITADLATTQLTSAESLWLMRHLAYIW